MVTDETVAMHAAREEEPGGDVDPAGHRCAALPGAGPPRQKEPAGQGAQPGPDEPGANPGAHTPVPVPVYDAVPVEVAQVAEHAVAPREHVVVPAAHRVHFVEPVKAAKAPNGHGVGADMPEISQ